MQRLPGKRSGDRRAENLMGTGGPFVDKGKLRAFLKDPLIKELGNYST